MVRNWAPIILAVVGLLLASGCNDGSRSVSSGSGEPGSPPLMLDLVAKAQPRVPDLPVPIGYKLDENRSLDVTTGGGRYVNHKYKGGEEKLAVKRFYERHMPVSRWTLTTARFYSGDVVMDFEKESERCQIKISDGDLLHKSNIYIHLWTSGPIQALSQAQDAK